jgi:hypothetical protein
VNFTPNMPEPDYRTYPLPSWSSVKGLLDTCPAEWLHQQNAPRTESAAMIWGTLLHAAVLEPHRLDEMVCEPVTVERDATGKLWTHTAADGETWRTQREAQAAAAEAMPADRYAVTVDLLDDLRLRAEQAAALLPDGDSGGYEVAMRGSIEGQPCKGKADAIAKIGGALSVLDLKTTGDVTPDAVQRAATQRHWFGQLWTYGELARQNGHAVDAYGILIVQAPHLTHAGGVLGLSDRYQPRPHARIVPIGVEGVAHGRAEAIRAWRTYLDCALRDHWPDWSETHPEPLEPSRWAVEAEPEEVVW